ncbi:hypothetical protein DAPPUDRAFT_105465 [Daphnia pulex]|uniref:Uncharacterized protein n=1 Tax=Daphnia pulex TaxID=6669 RepID=E9GQW8_DAPPU|nr:hypothetical protein DAPPUDRAFT_105465 [Daphnia pulex]|eukprot:EFX78186.1 hypothetical protein DAPPUDRAFT_105465 [Daphnia pulex]
MLSQQPLPNLAQPNKAISNCESQQQHQQQQQQQAKLMRIKQQHNQLVVNQVDEKAPPPSVCLVMEENLRMRRAIGDAVLTLTQWVHDTKDQNGNVASLVDRMKESVQKYNNSQQPEDVLKAMAIQMEARECEWAAERLAFQEKERVSKQMIFNLQQDNYRLRKSRIVSLY